MMTDFCSEEMRTLVNEIQHLNYLLGMFINHEGDGTANAIKYELHCKKMDLDALVRYEVENAADT